MVASLTNVTVRFIQLPYKDLDSFRLSSKGLDGVTICHSINNRRFTVTDVMDALYDVFLPHVRQVFGKDSVCVIAHDFEWPMGRAGSSSGDHARIKNTYMDSFRGKQPTTSNCSNLAMICGRLDNQVGMDEKDWTQLKVFVRQCRVRSEMSRIPAAVRRVYEPVENDSPLPHSHKFVRYILMLMCLPVMLIRMALECSWSLTMLTWLKDVSHSLCTSFKQNVIDKTVNATNHTGSALGFVTACYAAYPTVAAVTVALSSPWYQRFVGVFANVLGIVDVRRSSHECRLQTFSDLKILH